MPAGLSDPVVAVVGPDLGDMANRTGAKESTIDSLAGLYADREAYRALAADRGAEIAYRVHEFRPERVAPQELIFGTSTLFPGMVGREFFMTRGHIHENSDRPEVYICRRGRGVMHMEAPDGRTRPVEMTPGMIVYVPPHWIHRSVNVGDEPLVTLFTYPADAGQDYRIIEKAGGMRTLIVSDGAGGWAEADNPHYRPRTEKEQAVYMPA